MLKLSVVKTWYFVLCVVGEKYPTIDVGLFFGVSLFHYVMNFKAKGPKLKLGFWDQFKEYDEKILGFYEWYKWHVQLCFWSFGILEGINHIINVWKRTLTLLWELYKENGILKTSMVVMGKICLCCSVQFLFVPLSNF